MEQGLQTNLRAKQENKPHLGKAGAALPHPLSPNGGLFFGAL